MPLEIVLLPGLDGTGSLFESMILAAPAGQKVHVIRFPAERSGRYEELAEWVLAALPARPIALVAESFSGPLAVLIAERRPEVKAVVLCATFVTPPLPGWLRPIAPLVARVRPPTWAIRWLMTGGDASIAKGVHGALSTVARGTIVSRVMSTMSIDVTAAFERLSCPVLCLVGRQDRLVSRRAVSDIRRAKPSARFVVIDGPHLLFQACPADAWEHIGRFLEESAPSPEGRGEPDVD